MSELSKLFRDLNPFEREARARVDQHLKTMGLVEPHYYFGQFELKAKVDTLRDLRYFVDQYGGEIDYEAGRSWDRSVKAFAVVQIEGVKVHLCAYVSDEEAEAHGLW